MPGPDSKEWVTLAEAVTWLARAVGDEKATAQLRIALIDGAIRARAGSYRHEIGGFPSSYGRRGLKELSGNLWHSMSIDVERGEAFELQNGCGYRYYDVRVHSDGLESMTGRRLDLSSAAKGKGGRPAQQDAGEMIARVVIALVGRKGGECTPLSVKQIANELARIADQHGLQRPSEHSLTTYATSIRRVLMDRDE